MTLVAVSAGVGIASLGYSVYKGVKADAKASALEKGNKRPAYQIPDEYKQNLALAKQMAQIGLPQAAYNNQQNAISRNQAGAVGALSNSANPGANLSAIVRAGNDAQGNLNATDANARLSGQHGIMQANNAIAQQKLDAQQYNQFDKYSENFNRAQALRSAANADWNNAANGASGLAGSLAMGNYGYGSKQDNPQGVANWGSGTMGARNNALVLNTRSGFDFGNLGAPDYNYNFRTSL